MKRRKAFLCLSVVLLGALPAFAVQAFMDLGTGTSAPSISKDGTLIGGNDGAGFIAVNGVKTVTPGATPVDVEYLNGLPTAVGKSAGSAAYWQAGSWNQLPLVGGATTWSPTGIGVDVANNWWVSGYQGTGGSSGTSSIRYVGSTNTTTNIGGPASPSNTWNRSNAIADNGAHGGVGYYTGNSKNAMYGLPNSWLACNAGIGLSVESEAFDISSDGITKVGWGYASSGAWQGHYWVAGSPNLIPLYLGIDWAEGHAVDGDGNVFGGFTYTDGYTTQTAWIWQTGWATPKSVTQYLTEQGVNTAGWKFTNVTGISFDGLSFVGTGSLNNVNHTWAFSVVPEPSALALLLVGVCAMIRRR